MPDVFLSMHAHVMFGTKDGQPLLRPAMAARLIEQFAAIASDQGAQLVASGVML